MEAVKTDYRRAALADGDRAMLDFVAKLTTRPSSMTKGDVDTLRSHGFVDAAVHDIVQVTALFAYYNRLAEGMGIDIEDDFSPA